MKPLSRLAAWFYDYPDFNVTEQELAVLRAVKDGPKHESDVAVKLGVKPDELKVLLESLRKKHLLGRDPRREGTVWSLLWFPTLVSEAASLFLDPESVCLSVPGRKLLKPRPRKQSPLGSPEVTANAGRS